jgi:hypothetical protein
VAIAVALGLLGASPAAAKTIGSDLKPAPAGYGYGCGAVQSCAVQQLTLPGNPFPMRAKFDGRITKWRFRKGPIGDGDTYPVTLRVVHRRKNGKVRFIRSSKPGVVGAASGTYAFKAKLPIRKGDGIAISLPVGVDALDVAVVAPEAKFQGFFPAPANGTSALPFLEGGKPETGVEYLWNATVRKRR